jgi:hypothetical protein
MTALAMIIGMLPMSLGLGEGGEQNAPLGRAVIGGLLCATFFTLVFVPIMYTLLRRKPPAHEMTDENLESDEEFGEQSVGEFNRRNGLQPSYVSGDSDGRHREIQR